MEKEIGLLNFFKNIILIIFALGAAAGLLSQNVNPNGFNTFYFDDGSVSSEGFLNNGKPDGYWKNYYQNGNLKSQGNRKLHLLDSNWIFYFSDGFIKEEIYYSKGLRNGITKTYVDSNIIYDLTPYVNDTIHGKYEQFYETGELKKVKFYKKGVLYGRAFEYAKDGRIITIVDYNTSGSADRIEKINRLDEDGNKTGNWKLYDEQGNIETEANYKQGELDGILREFNAKGELQSMKKFNQGIEDLTARELMFVDLYKEYYPSGELHFVGAKDDNNKKQGIFQEYSKAGKIIKTYIYEQDSLLAKGLIDEKGLKQGKWYYYFPGGERKTKGQYKNDIKIGNWLYLHKNGAEEQKGKYVKGLQQGEWIWYYANKTEKRRENFSKGKESGPSVEYDSLGNVVSKGEYINGLKEGDWFYQIGDHKEEGLYLDGQKHGKWVFTYDNGQINFEGNYKTGYENGKHTWYYRNGKIRKQGKYNLGKKEGDWKKYDEEGNLFVTFTYRGGSLIKADGQKIKPAIPPTIAD